MLLYDHTHGCAGLDTAYSNLERYYDMFYFVRCPEGMDPMSSSTASRPIAGEVWPECMFIQTGHPPNHTSHRHVPTDVRLL